MILGPRRQMITDARTKRVERKERREKEEQKWGGEEMKIRWRKEANESGEVKRDM